MDLFQIFLVLFAGFITVVSIRLLQVIPAILPFLRPVFDRGFWYTKPFSKLSNTIKTLILGVVLAIPSILISGVVAAYTYNNHVLALLVTPSLSYFAYLLIVNLISLKTANIGGIFGSSKQKIPKSFDGFILETTGKHPLHIANPDRGVFICGGAGSGKTASIINPILEQAALKNYTGIVYDFKFPNLANQVYDNWASSFVKTYFLNFTDLSRSHRINPIAPAYIKTTNHAREAAKTLISNLDFKAAQKRDYWMQASEGLLTATFWYFKKIHPSDCNLPTVISFLLNPDTEHIISCLKSDIEVSNLASSFLSSEKNEKQLTGIMSSLQNYLSILASPEIFWVLSGDEVNLHLNSPNKPGILVLGNDPSLSSTFSPLLSLVASVSLKMMNTRGNLPSLVLLDEAPTLFIPNFAQIPATAREHKVSTIYSVQDIAQMEALLSPLESEMIISNLGTAFYGRVTNIKTAEKASKLFGKYDQTFQTQSQSESEKKYEFFEGSDSRSQGQSIQQRDRITASDIVNLQTGQFVGINAEGNAREFKETFKYKIGTEVEIPSFANVNPQEIDHNYNRILNLGRFISS